jgi:hypothetical protein
MTFLARCCERSRKYNNCADGELVRRREPDERSAAKEYHYRKSSYPYLRGLCLPVRIARAFACTWM